MTAGEHIDKIVEGVESAIIAGANDASEAMIKDLTTWYGKVQGMTKAKQLQACAGLNNEINRIIKGSKYPAAVLKAARSYEDIQFYALQVLGDANPTYKPYDEAARLGIDGTRELAVETLTERLTTADISVQIKEPIRQALIRNVQAGAPQTQVRDFLEKALTTPAADKLAPFARYSSQIAMDGVLGWDGQIYDTFRNEYETTEIRYIGSLISDSRPQCIKWVQKMNGRIPVKDLQKEITWAQRNGSGMKSFTTPSTFCTDRGGWHCRHKAIPVFTPQS